MSYCLAIHTDHGLVSASASRTPGGVDQVNTYSKMHRFEVTGERLFVLLCAGNLVQDIQAGWSATVAQGMRDLPRFPWESPDLFDSP